LGTIELPSSLTSIDIRAFDGCTGLKSIAVVANSSLSPATVVTTLLENDRDTTDDDDDNNGVTASDGATTTTNNTDKCLLATALEKANFHPIELTTVLQNDKDTIRRALESDDNSTYLNWNQLTRRMDQYTNTNCHCSSLPLFVAAKQGIRWSGGDGWLKQILMANRPAIEETDSVTGLNPFMLAAIGMNSDLEAVYHLLVEHPIALISATTSSE